MAQLQQTSITGSIASTGSLIISGSEPVQLPLLNSGSGEIDLTTPYQLWFDSGDNYVKYHLKGSYNTGVWSAASTMNIARQALAGLGTQDAGLAAGGESPTKSCTEEYDGSSWSAGGALIIARFNVRGVGTQNAGLVFGGATPSQQNATEEYDGSSFTEGGNLITSRNAHAGAGTQNAALAFGGATPSIVSCTEEYNGSAWASSGALITSRQAHGGAGIQNSGLAFGGETPTKVSCTEHYNGSTWSVGSALNTTRSYIAGAGECQYSAIAFGGFTPTNVACTEEYDGTSWTAASALISARRNLSGAGTKHTGLAFGGYISALTSNTEEWTRPYVPPFSCYLIGAWSVGGATIATGYSARAGIQNSYSSVAAYNDSDAHENYNGTSWSTKTNAPTGNVSRAGAGVDADNTVIFGGNSIATTIEWNGSSWATCGDMNVARYYHSGTGTQNDAGTVGGYNGAYRACHENYSGATWSTATALPTTAGFIGSAGSGADDNLVAGANGSSCSANAYQWNGSSWTTLPTMNVAKSTSQGNGASSNDAMMFGGSRETSPYSADKCTEIWNGSTWSNDAEMVIGGSIGYSGGSGGTTTAGIAGPRYVYPSYVACVEEYDRTLVNLATYRCYIVNNSWSAGGNMITGRGQLGSGGTPTAALAVVGSGPGIPAGSSCVEEYNGTTWATGGSTPFSAEFGQTNGGTQNAFGAANFSSDTQEHIEYNGSSWSDSGATLINATLGRQGNTDDQDLMIAMGGYSGNTNKTEEYNGSSWSEGGTLITARGLMYAGGTQNATIAAGGYVGPPANNSVTCVELYNGTAFSAATAIPIAKRSGGGFGAQNDFIVTGGVITPTAANVCTTYWNGTSWSALSDLPATTCYHGATSNQSTADGGLVFGGYPASSPVATYHWGGCTCVFSNLHCITRCLDATCTQI